MGITIFCLLFLQQIFAPLAHAQPSQVSEVILKNGLKVLLLENHKSPAVTFQVWYRVGSRNEQDGKSGLSHFLEHMLFSGTHKVARGDYARIISKNGGRANAFTTRDATVYFATMSREKIGIEIELEADRMANAVLDGAHSKTEKKVVLEERRLRTEDSPSSALAEITGAVAYTVHPYRRPVVGWMEDIRNLSDKDLKDYYRTHYTPNNAFIVVVGDFSSEEILKKIEGAFGQIPRRSNPPDVKAVEPAQRGERRVILKKDAELPALLLLYHTPNLNLQDSFALDLLRVVLTSGRTSRLYNELVYRQRVARYVAADYSRLSIGPPAFSIEAQVMPGKDIGKVEHAIYAVLNQVKTDMISDREIRKAKNKLESGFIFSQDSNFGQAMRIGKYEIAGGWRRKDEYLAGMRKLTPEDLLSVAQRYLDPDRRTVGILMPTRESEQ
jgi:zinc protease